MKNGRILVLPLHDRYGADRVRRRTIDDLGADREIDDRAVRNVRHAIDAGRLEKNARLLTKHFFIVSQLRQVNVNRTDLSARDGKIGWIFVQTQGLAPAALSGL